MIKWHEKRDIFALVIVILIALFIFIISSQSFENGSPGPSWSFKPVLYHFTVFFLFSFFLSIALTHGRVNNRYLVLFAVLFGVAYGATDELHQLFVTNRSCSLEDFAVDSIGVLAASLIYFISLVFKKSKF